MSFNKYEVLENDEEISSVSEIIPDRLYFVTIKNKLPVDTATAHFFSVDNESNGAHPFSLAKIAKYLKQMDSKLSSPDLSSKVLVQYTSGSEKRRRFAAFYVGAYSIIHLQLTPESVIERIAPHSFRRLRALLTTLHKAVDLGLVDFEDFDEDVFISLDEVMLNWVVPRKILLFSGPAPYTEGRRFPPKRYLEYFRHKGVKTMIRVSHVKFAANPFVGTDLCHYDLNKDGAVPSERVFNCFLDICENSEGAVVVHNRYLLGPSHSLIGAYLVKHYMFTAEEAYSWMRLCSPEVFQEEEKSWLAKNESALLQKGDDYRGKQLGDNVPITHHPLGVYSYLEDNKTCIDTDWTNLPISSTKKHVKVDFQKTLMRSKP